ncbi:MAG TPA: copper chaperone PCu(A)C [Steroidobacteraceae bacterium]
MAYRARPDRCVRCAALSAALVMVVAAMGAAGATSASGPTVQVSAAWVRWLPASLPAAAYLTLTNTGDHSAVLRGASSTSYRQVSLHRSTTRQGMSAMQPVAEITLAPHSSLSFAAAGYHIMLQQPTRAVNPGGHVPIALHFADGSSITALFEVRRPDAGPANP